MLEGLLEDQLLDEPEALHFALQPQARGGGPLWVATCDRAWLRAALQVLESAQRDMLATEGVAMAMGELDERSRRIVELHQGSITVDDAPGGGALFRIEIPDGPHSRS